MRKGIWKNESATKREKKCDNKTRKNIFYLFVILYKLSQSKNWDTLCTFPTFYLKEPLFVYNFFYKI